MVIISDLNSRLFIIIIYALTSQTSYLFFMQLFIQSYLDWLVISQYTERQNIFYLNILQKIIHLHQFRTLSNIFLCIYQFQHQLNHYFNRYSISGMIEFKLQQISSFRLYSVQILKSLSKFILQNVNRYFDILRNCKSYQINIIFLVNTNYQFSSQLQYQKYKTENQNKQLRKGNINKECCYVLKQYKMEYYLMSRQTAPKLEQKSPQKMVYKNNKRKVRNTLIYLVGLHMLFIFGFVTLLCFQYLVPIDWGSSLYLGLISDFCFFCYIIETLIAIKFKNRKMLISSIATLALSIGTKAGAFIVLLQSGKQVPLIIYIHLALIILNCIIPWSLLLLWNKLKQSKWRQTFDMYTKLNRHLSEEVIANPPFAQ